MATLKRLLTDVETRTLVWLARGRASSLVIVGTVATASLGFAALGAQATTPTRHTQPATAATLPLSAYGCAKDTDGDGHIFCDGSVAITKLPASFGSCETDAYDGSRIYCDGTSR